MILPAKKTRFLLGGILLLALMLRVPGWFTQDEKTRFRLFEPDEFQHVQIAVYQVQCLDESLLTDWDVVRKMFNARGYGIQLGTLAWICHRLGGMELSPDHFILLGRLLSSIYAQLLILLVYLLARRLFGKNEPALMAALLMAVCDLNVTYSHYSLPAVGYVFWCYLFVFSVILFSRKLENQPTGKFAKRWPYLLLVAFCAAAVFAFKFDFIPFFISVVFLVILLLRNRHKPITLLLWLPGFFLLFVLSFAVLTSFNFSWERIQYSFWDLHRQNYDVIPEDDHWLFNPMVYLTALIAGTSIIQFFLAGRGLVEMWKKKALSWTVAALLLLFLGLEFGIRWSSDVPFVRRANIFMPALALLAAYAWAQFKPVHRKYAGILMVTYTLGLCLVSQSNAWWDTRYTARTYLQEQQSGQKIKYGSYSYARGMPAGVTLKDDEDILVIHEAAYSRNWRSFTTPFRIPRCCEEVYHCGEEDCLFIQSILSGDNSDYRIIRQFSTRQWFPERILFKRTLGNFETFLGDVIILEKIKQ
ncbi:MAG: glycosyltransferase family 39 protein [Saprospiraceae bacterium]|nr:glycosyltransferase family 39 protein [Lewinella sp.]